MTQDLATLYKILFIRGRFRVQNASKSFSFFGQGGRPRTPLGELGCSPQTCDWEEGYLLTIPLPLSVFGVSMCGPVFTNMITGNPTVITSATWNLCVFCFCRDNLNGLLLEGAYRQCFVQQEDGIVDEQVDKTQKQRSFSVVDMLLSIRCQRLYIIYTYTDQRPRDASNIVSLTHRGILFWTAAMFTTERQCSRDADFFHA